MTTTEPQPDLDAPATRAERHEANLRRILDAAMEVIVANGFAALSINKLAGALGYTPGALYRYFPSKDALLSALVGEIIDEIGGRLADAVNDAETSTAAAAVQDFVAEDPLAPIARAATTWLSYARTSPHRFGLIAALLATPQIVMTDTAAAQDAIARTLKALAPLVLVFDRAARLGALANGDPKERTLLLFAGLQGVLNLRKQAERAPDQLDLDRLYRAMFDTLMVGFGRARTPNVNGEIG